MMIFDQKFNNAIPIFLILISLSFNNLSAQEEHAANFDRDTPIMAAREMMVETRYCALITLDESGQ